MASFLKQSKAIFSSATSFKEALQTTSQNGEVRYNKDLLPSPPGKTQASQPSNDGTDASQRIGDGDGNIILRII
jgi:hypothetical protein